MVTRSVTRSVNQPVAIPFALAGRSMLRLPYRGASLSLAFDSQQYAMGAIGKRPAAFAFSDLITFTRASGGGIFNAAGQYEWLPANTPRFDYDPVTGEAKGLLVEEQRTRLNTVSAAPVAAQAVNVTAAEHTVSFYGSGSLALTGAHAAAVDGAGAYPARRTYTFTPTAGSLTIAPTGDVRMLQLEAGAFATSAIAGEGAQVTRAADIASVNELSPWYNPEQGTLFVEAVPKGFRGDTATAGIASLDNGAPERFQIRTYQANGSIAGTIASGGVIQAAIEKAFELRVGERFSAALSAAQNDFALFKDGTLIGTDLSGSMPSPTRLAIGGAPASVAFSGHIRSIRYFPRRLSNSELQALTA